MPLTAAQVYDYTVEQGTTFRRTITWYNDDAQTVLRDLTGYTARMQIRPTVASTDVLLSLTNTAGITLGGTAGTIAIVMTDAQTAAFTFTTAVYDLEMITPSGDVIRLIKGTLTLDKEVTR